MGNWAIWTAIRNTALACGIGQWPEVSLHKQHEVGGKLNVQAKNARIYSPKCGDKTLGGVRLREKKYHFHLGHHNKNSFVGKPKDLAVHVWYVNHIGFL